MLTKILPVLTNVEKNRLHVLPDWCLILLRPCIKVHKYFQIRQVFLCIFPSIKRSREKCGVIQSKGGAFILFLYYVAEPCLLI